MYCLNCGKPIGDNAPVCPYCGKRNTSANAKGIFGRLGFVLGLLSVIPVTAYLCLPAIIFSAIGIRRAKRAQSSLKQPVAGLAVGCAVLLVYAVLLPVILLR